MRYYSEVGSIPTGGKYPIDVKFRELRLLSPSKNQKSVFLKLVELSKLKPLLEEIAQRSFVQGTDERSELRLLGKSYETTNKNGS